MFQFNDLTRNVASVPENLSRYSAFTLPQQT